MIVFYALMFTEDRHIYPTLAAEVCYNKLNKLSDSNQQRKHSIYEFYSNSKTAGVLLC